MDGSRIDRGFGLRSGGIEPLTAARPARPANERDDAMKLWGDARVVRGMRAQLEMRRARLAAGDAPLGWKVGFAAPEMLKRLDIAGPLVGFLTRNALVQSGASIPLTGWTKPVAEPENRRLCCPRCFGLRRPGHRQGRNRRDLTGNRDARSHRAAGGPRAHSRRQYLSAPRCALWRRTGAHRQHIGRPRLPNPPARH